MQLGLLRPLKSLLPFTAGRRGGTTTLPADGHPHDELEMSAVLDEYRAALNESVAETGGHWEMARTARNGATAARPCGMAEPEQAAFAHAPGNEADLWDEDDDADADLFGEDDDGPDPDDIIALARSQLAEDGEGDADDVDMEDDHDDDADLLTGGAGDAPPAGCALDDDLSDAETMAADPEDDPEDDPAAGPAADGDGRVAIDAFDGEHDLLVVEYSGPQAPRVTSQQLSAEGLTVTLSDGTIVEIDGMEQRLAANRIVFVARRACAA
ncbi:hypothetical protein KUH32_02230 [Thalassococcus sp. CAU 1522]|uniref:Uncharacterized protein n=1 Tax=Thalassococcus arenae TaxID=2851652 RepID=A0ABS6N3H8_9RHOB|nr:hypothetical protein [Thalassococcus arenae]MBV2358578.1 hypothetical protein [Thalassococcus arenae]